MKVRCGVGECVGSEAKERFNLTEFKTWVGQEGAFELRYVKSVGFYLFKGAEY